MTHTSTEQPEALRLADACAADWEIVRPHLVVQMLRDQHARILELEAAQAGRVALSDEQIEPIAIDVLGYGALSEPDMDLFTQSVRAIEAAHGITQEKQG